MLEDILHLTSVCQNKIFVLYQILWKKFLKFFNLNGLLLQTITAYLFWLTGLKPKEKIENVKKK